MSRPDIALQINQPKFDTPDEGLQRMLTLRDLTEKINDSGLGAVGGQQLPDYHP